MVTIRYCCLLSVMHREYPSVHLKDEGSTAVDQVETVPVSVVLLRRTSSNVDFHPMSNRPAPVPVRPGQLRRALIFHGAGPQTGCGWTLSLAGALSAVGFPEQTTVEKSARPLDGLGNH